MKQRLDHVLRTMLQSVKVVSIDKGRVDVRMTSHSLSFLYRRTGLQRKCYGRMPQTMSRQAHTVKPNLAQIFLDDSPDSPRG